MTAVREVQTMPERLDVSDVGELTLGELELIEQYGGAPLSKLQADAGEGGEGVYRVRFARAMGLVMLRRRARAAGAPDPTYDDTADMLLPESVGEVATTTPDPTPAPAPAGRRKSRA
jgi:hypothetical protein